MPLKDFCGSTANFTSKTNLVFKIIKKKKWRKRTQNVLIERKRLIILNNIEKGGALLFHTCIS